MNPEKWKKIDQLFDEVLELSEAERETYISEKCGDDEELKNELQSLLNADSQSENFIEDSAIKVVTKQLIDNENLPKDESLLGKTFGTYKIESLIGEGGMGEVYLASDEKLKRKVALKVIPKHYIKNEERVRRLILEARAISTLNHPNIVTIHDIGEIDSTHYITTEFVEGKTLRELIGKNISISESLSIIIQCCDALSAAHKAGVIHRDIKPENIMVRHDGYVKVLDFGLAKLTESNQTDSIGFTQTLRGTIMGTPAYMSPEQASGSKIDNRTDLWSIAVVLYELLTGVNPFRKDNRQSTIQSILKDNPELPTQINNKIPEEIDTIIIKALEKNPDLSYQTASDFSADLKRLQREMDNSSLKTQSLSSPPFKPQKQFSPFLITSLSFLIVIPLAGFLIWFFYFSQNEMPKTDWTKAKSVQLTSQAGSEIFPNVSPDGESFVYAAKTQDNFDIYLQRVGGKKVINLTENSTEDDTQPAFSKDGEFIAFRSERNGGGIFLMESTGENPRRLSDFGFHPSWSPDGTEIVVSQKGYERPSTRDRSSLWIIDVKTGKRRKLIGNFANQPAWSPNGNRIAFWFIQSGGRRDVATISPEGGEPIPVTNSANTNWNPVWSPDGKYLYYSSDLNGNMAFWRVRIDESTGKVIGKAEIIPTPAKFNSHLSFSSDGKRLVYVQTNNQSNIKAVEFDERKGKPKGDPFWITRGDYEILRPDISPDGKRFVVHLARQTQDDIVIMGRNGKNWVDLTNDKYFDRYPRWSPDGKKIAFASDRSGVYEAWIMNSDGTNLRQASFNRKGSTSFPIWSPDGKKLTYHIGQETFILDLSKDLKDQTPQRLPLFEGLKYLVWDWSVDGKKLIGNWGDNDGNSGVGYLSLENNKYVKVSFNKSEFPYWLSDSQRAIWANNGKIYLADTNTKEIQEILSIPDEYINSANISKDNKLLYFAVSSSESNIWMLDLKEK